MNTNHATSAFEEGAITASQDFRTLMDAVARPGTVQPLPGRHDPVGNMNRGAILTAITLCDHETPVWLAPDLNSEEIKDFIRFHCSAPIVASPEKAMFAFFDRFPDLEELAAFPTGTPAYPDTSTTLIIQVDALASEGNIVLSGPGIQTNQAVHISGMTDDFRTFWKDNRSLFPLGLDVILASETGIVGLPRTVSMLEVA